MTLEERFRYIMKLNNLTASAFADEIGVQRSSISHILSGRNKPSLEFIQKVLNRFPKVDALWLVNGTAKVEGDRIKPNEELSHDENQTIASTKKSTSEQEKNKSPLTVNKSITKVLVFYSDNSFEEFTPSSFPANL